LAAATPFWRRIRASRRESHKRLRKRVRSWPIIGKKKRRKQTSCLETACPLRRSRSRVCLSEEVRSCALVEVSGGGGGEAFSGSLGVLRVSASPSSEGVSSLDGLVTLSESSSSSLLSSSSPLWPSSSSSNMRLREVATPSYLGSDTLGCRLRIADGLGNTTQSQRNFNAMQQTQVPHGDIVLARRVFIVLCIIFDVRAVWRCVFVL
jgi:hypothetical protein